MSTQPDESHDYIWILENVVKWTNPTTYNEIFDNINMISYYVSDGVLRNMWKDFDYGKLHGNPASITWNQVWGHVVASYPVRGKGGADTQAIIDAVKQMLGEVQTTISNTIGDSGSGLIGDLSSFTGSAFDSLKNTIADIGTFLDGTFGSVSTTASGVVDNIKTFLNGVAEEVASTYSTITRDVGETFYKVLGNLDETYSSVLGALKNDYEYISGWIDRIGSTAMQDLKNSYDLVVISQQDIIKQVSDEINNALPALEAVGETSLKALAALMGGMTGQLVPNIIDLVKRSGVPFGLIDNEENKGTVNDLTGKATTLWQTLTDPESNLVTSLKLLEEQAGTGSLAAQFLYAFVMLVTVGVHMANAVAIIAAPKATDALYQVNTDQPVTEFTMQEAAGLCARRFMDNDEAVNVGLKGGYDHVKTNQAIAATRPQLAVSDLNNAVFRHIITEDHYRSVLQRHGYQDSDIETIRSLAYVLPSYSDLITMAVREVFSNDIAEHFGLFGDLPADFVTEAAKQGLSEEWAKRYWGAHWKLPSFQQGADMFHRGLIDEETLNMLVRALDVSPIWREPLKGTTYNLITRVDLRRIYALGLITREEVVERFRWEGYSESDAELLTRFYDLYTGQDDTEDAYGLKSITLAQVKNLWTLGTLDDEQAVDQLTLVGYSGDLSRIYVQSWSDEAAYKTRKDLITRLTKKAIREDMDDRQVEALFADMNLAPEELKNVKKVIAVEEEQYTATPSKSELKAMYTADIIDLSTWKSYMKRLGYNDEIVDWYGKLYYGDTYA